MIQTTLTITSAYLSFFLAENDAGVSGVLCTVFAALMLAQFAGPVIVSHHTMENVWHALEHMGNTLIFALAGLIIYRSATVINNLTGEVMIQGQVPPQRPRPNAPAVTRQRPRPDAPSRGPPDVAAFRHAHCARPRPAAAQDYWVCFYTFLFCILIRACMLFILYKPMARCTCSCLLDRTHARQMLCACSDLQRAPASSCKPAQSEPTAIPLLASCYCPARSPRSPGLATVSDPMTRSS